MPGKKLLFRILRYSGILKHLNITIKTYVNNRKVLIPMVNGIGFDNYVNPGDSWMLFVLNSLYHNSLFDGSFIDVGVNIGQTLIKVKAIDPTINYIGFEPNPFCINYVNRLIEINNYDKTRILPVAISNKTSISTLQLYYQSNVDSTASMIRGFRKKASVKRTIDVPVFKFSDITFKDPFKISILKIDVEGGELEVLESFIELIRSDEPIILIEILPAYSIENSLRIERQEKIRKLLEEMGYYIFRVLKQKDKYHQIQQISKFDIHADLNLCDYILAPDSKADLLSATMAKMT